MLVLGRGWWGKDRVWPSDFWGVRCSGISLTARLAQSVERQTLNLVVVGSSPTVGESFDFWLDYLRAE